MKRDAAGVHLVAGEMCDSTCEMSQGSVVHTEAGHIIQHLLEIVTVTHLAPGHLITEELHHVLIVLQDSSNIQTGDMITMMRDGREVKWKRKRGG